MVRGPYFDRNGLKRGAWSKEEDDKLRAFVQRYGHKNWRQLPKFAGLQRCGKSCKIRWLNYLRPDVKHGGYSKEEEDLIIQLYDQLGSKWSKIAEYLPGRTDNEIKNHWHTHLRKRETKKEISKVKEEQTIESSQKEEIIQEVTEEKRRPEIDHPNPSQLITIFESSHVSPSSSSTALSSSSSSSSSITVAENNYGLFDGIGDDLYKQGDQYPRSDYDQLRAFVQQHDISIDEWSFPESSPSECSFLSSDHLNYMEIVENPIDWIIDESSNRMDILESDFWTEPFVLDLEINTATKYEYSVSSNAMSWELNYI